MSCGRGREALSVLQRIRGSADVHSELEEMVQSGTNDSGGLRKSVTARGLLEDPRIRRALVLGCGLQFLQQLSGINTVMYYSATIFRYTLQESRRVYKAFGRRRHFWQRLKCPCPFPCHEKSVLYPLRLGRGGGEGKVGTEVVLSVVLTLRYLWRSVVISLTPRGILDAHHDPEATIERAARIDWILQRFFDLVPLLSPVERGPSSLRVCSPAARRVLSSKFPDNFSWKHFKALLMKFARCHSR